MRGSPIDRLRFEAVVGGRRAYLVAPGVLALFAGLGIAFGSLPRMLIAGLETGVPLAAGLATASLLAAEPALELQLAAPGGVRPAILLRAGTLFAWSAMACFVAWIAGELCGAFGGLVPAGGPLLAQLTWLAPLAGFTVAGALLAVASRSRAVAAGSMMAFWVGGHAFHDVFESEPLLRSWYPFLTTYAHDTHDWAETRVALLALAVVALAVLAAWLGAGEWLLAGEDR